MAFQLILSGNVQGVYCRAYCKNNAVKLNLKGSASNLFDGTVKVVLDTVDRRLIDEFIRCLKENPYHFNFYGQIDNIKVEDYEGAVTGDYNF